MYGAAAFQYGGREQKDQAAYQGHDREAVFNHDKQQAEASNGPEAVLHILPRAIN
jgi:hypothetical protein